MPSSKKLQKTGTGKRVRLRTDRPGSRLSITQQEKKDDWEALCNSQKF